MRRSGAGRNAGLVGLQQGDESLAREELRRQIARFERQLGELFTSAFPRMELSWSVPAAGAPRILGVGELEEVRDAMAQRLADVRALLDERGKVEEANRELIEQMLASPEEFKWVRVSNVDIGERGCRHWHVRPRWGIVGMFLNWWRVKLSSGCPLARGRRRSRRGAPHRSGQVKEP